MGLGGWVRVVRFECAEGGEGQIFGSAIFDWNRLFTTQLELCRLSVLENKNRQPQKATGRMVANEEWTMGC
jgi:hypothetical protein